MKNFPTPIQKILPATFLVVSSIAIFSGCHSSIAPVEASTTRNPVVAPAGTVLRVRMIQALDAGRSRPGDRFEGVLDAPVMIRGAAVLPKGAPVEGHVLTAGSVNGRVLLSLTLDTCELYGRKVVVSTSAVTRTSGRKRLALNGPSLSWRLAGDGESVSVAAESIMGFTLTDALTA